MKNIEIQDHSLLDLVAVVSIDSERPEPNTFTFSFTQADVAAAAIDLGIIAQPWDIQDGRKNQQFRIGYQMAGEKGETQYFDYKQMLWWIGGADREAIVLHLFEAYKKRLDEIAVENTLLESLI